MKRYSVGQIGPYWIGPVIRDDGELVKYEEAARIRAQRDRLEECLKMARNWIADRDGDTRIYDTILAELDKEKQS